ncbi:hypothetical protein LDL76_09960 [Salegentibacter mishustinae]|uniref:curli-like amyloid fiber formation chaperone CsgH n=1 Tax=Salegentibacter mishustinae TaxID=270918 RepID=UPI001CE0E0F8|nr:curli-like amyloid fiber formation chaperone CsgH [Salegentibacter mishustinae]UBZ05694.1 hypothetical protein LDL76_09960 [Salegentibacter mishustinae]
MKDFINIPALFLMLFCVSAAFGQEDEYKNITAKINLETKDRLLSISGQAINNSSQPYQLRYELSVITGNKNNSNSSQNKQSGNFTLPASAIKILSNTSISHNPGNNTIIKLYIFNSDKVVARDSLNFQF